MSAGAQALAPVLYTEDDENDAFLMRHAFRRLDVQRPLVVVSDGQLALDYLAGAAPYDDRSRHPPPALLLLDLNLPRLSGFEVLQWVRAETRFRHLLIVILSSSNHRKDLDRAYALGANAYFVKPPDVARRHELVITLRDEWLK